MDGPYKYFFWSLEHFKDFLSILIFVKVLSIYANLIFIKWQLKMVRIW